MPVARLSYAQLEGLWVQAGGPRALAPLMAAIALAESSGNPSARNDKDNGGTQTSWGLWQISDGTHNMPVANIMDPLTNAKQAVAKYHSEGLTAWGSYTTGAYRQYMQQGVAPSNNLPSGSTSTGNAQPASVSGDIGSAIGQGFADAFLAIFKPFIEIAVWGAETMLGVTLMVAGFLILVFNSKEAKGIEGEVAQTLIAPEAGAAEKIAQKSSTTSIKEKPVSVEKRQSVKSAKSREEFMAMRKSGYQGPIRRDY